MSFIRLFCLLLLLGGTASAVAVENSDDPGYLGVSAGAGEILASKKIPLVGVEYRFAAKYRGIHPVLLGAKAKDGASYVGIAALYNFDLSPTWRITISSGPGYYSRNRTAKDLGSSIEFLSNLEVSARIHREQRLALSFGHVSNGSIGDHNPGSETLRLVYLIPFK